LRQGNSRAKQLEFTLSLLTNPEYTKKRFTLKDLKRLIKISRISRSQAQACLNDLITLGYLQHPENHPKSYKFSKMFYRCWMGIRDREKARLAKEWIQIILSQPLLLKIRLTKEVKRKICETIGLNEVQLFSI
jgi:hypothetical protein